MLTRTRRRRYTRTQKRTPTHTHMFTRTYTHASYAHKQHMQLALKHRIHRRTNTYAHTHTTHTHTRTPTRTQLPTHPHIHTHPSLFITHTHTHAHTHTHVHTHTRTHTHTHKHPHIHLHTYTHAHACTHTHTYTQTHTCTHMHTCTYTHIHARTYTHTHTQESLADEKVAWKLASDHVLPQDVSPAVPSNAKPFTLRSPQSMQPKGERGRFERRTEGKQHDPSGMGELAGGAVVKTGRKGQQAHEWKEQARPPSPRSSSLPGSAQLAINISASSPISSTGSSAKEPGNISEAAHTSTQEADKQRTAGMEEPPISYRLNEKWLENGPKGKGGGEKVIKEKVSQNQRVEINNLQKNLAVVEDQVDYLPDVLCVAAAASIPPPPLPPPLPFPHPPTPSASCPLLLLLPIPTHLPVSRGFSSNSPRSAHVRASCTQATQVEGDSPVSSRMHALQTHLHQLLSANLTSARNSSIPSFTANDPTQEHENRLVCALQCVAMCCSVLRCGAVCCGVVQRVAVLLQCSRNGDYRHQSRLVCVCIRLFVSHLLAVKSNTVTEQQPLPAR